MMDSTVNEKAESLKKWATWGGVALAGFVVAPVVFITIKGLIGAAIAGGLAFTMVTLAPWVGLKISNWKYRLIEDEKTSHIAKVTQAAAENPIETLRNILIQNKTAFNKFKESVTQAVTARDNFAQKVDTFKKQFPLRAPEFEAKLKQMTSKIERKKEALSQAKDQLALGESKLEEMQAYWQMSQAMQDANKAAGLDTEDVFTQLKMDTAVDSVFESMNKAFAQLEVEDHLAEESPVAIEDKPSETINPVVQAQRVKTL